ncbi:hypothetical protein [Nannocystis bainbridge]|uniref:Uncharacterized protein n=1 Tax=Nannocystis bainbridge TaxID=2995303 RepID=A0ABT5E5C7_9BACT|nr:hypothetical protein [Nannocystis bainbridge]MDC0719956.1 hypothetical protein [Nannocystis bainbridge]
MKSLVLPLALCAALPACDVTAGSEPAAARSTTVAAQTPSRGRLVAGERVERVIAWPDPASRDERTRARLSPAALAAVAASPVPVLAPADPLWRPPQISSPRTPDGPGFGFSLATAAPGRTLTLHGSRLATLLADVGRHEGPERLRGVPGFVSANEGIVTATWIEHGAAYALDLECASTRDPACALPALRAEVEALVLVGGGER